jgi:hypothetical protein
MRDNCPEKRFEKAKILRDFSFLFQMKPQSLSDTVAKYTLREGNGELLS